MKILYSRHKLPQYMIFTDYVERALKKAGCQTFFFDSRSFILPARIRTRIRILHLMDLRLLNRKLVNTARRFRPDLFIEEGGWSVLPGTVDAIKGLGAKTVLWTNDVPREFEPITRVAPHYDYVFTAGTEAIEVLERYNIKNLHLLPFACDPDIHKPVSLTPDERKHYGTDVCFVGSWNPDYLFRKTILEELTDFNLGLWGSGWNALPNSSPLKSFVRGDHTGPEEWVKIYSASRITLCIHYHDPAGKIPSYQAGPKVFEALACGAFVVVDNQKDVLSIFKPGEHLVVFDTIEDLRRIISFYLSNPDKAAKIAEKGRSEVLKRHTYLHRVKRILSITQ
jgi:spore maturation protein CgeB